MSGALGSGRKELLVYVHGYNNTLASGLMRTAQLKVDMKIDGAAVLYSFPSKGSVLPWALAHDYNETMWPDSVRQFGTFLRHLCETTGADKVHLVGHSLGCNVLIRALDNMHSADGTKTKRRFDEVVFAAPAVGQADFRMMLDKCAPLSRRTTVYTSSGDLALRLLSSAIDLRIAGVNASALAGIANVDVVDTQADQTWLRPLWGDWGHMDFADGGIEDMRGIVWLSLDPLGRRRLIAPRPDDKAPTHWAVKPANAYDASVYSEALYYSRRLDLEAA